MENEKKINIETFNYNPKRKNRFIILPVSEIDIPQWCVKSMSKLIYRPQDGDGKWDLLEIKFLDAAELNISKKIYKKRHARLKTCLGWCYIQFW